MVKRCIKSSSSTVKWQSGSWIKYKMIKAWWIGRIRFVWFSNTAYVLRSTFKSKTHTFLSSMLHVFTLFFKNSMNDIWLSIYEYSMNDYLFPAHIVVYPVNSWNIAKTIKFIAFQVFLLQRNIGGGGSRSFRENRRMSYERHCSWIVKWPYGFTLRFKTLPFKPTRL